MLLYENVQNISSITKNIKQKHKGNHTRKLFTTNHANYTEVILEFIEYRINKGEN